MNLRGKRRVIPHGKPEYLIPLDERLGPIFRKVKVRSIGGQLDVDSPASNQHDSNPATTIPLLCWLSTKHNLIDFIEKAFPASEMKEISKKM